MLDPRRSVLGKVLLTSLAGFLLFVAVWGIALSQVTAPGELRVVQVFGAAALFVWLITALLSGALLSKSVIKPLRRMDRLVHGLFACAAFEPVETRADDEVGRLAKILNEAALQVRRDLEPLSGPYPISFMIGTGPESTQT